MKSPNNTPIVQAVLAALLFGASAPLSKLLLGEIEPIPLAAFLYLGSGLGLLALKLFQSIRHQTKEKEAGITSPDYPWLLGAILAGGVAAPIVLLVSLKNTPAATASVLLNFESVATTLIAAFAFKEAVSRRAWWAIVLITLSAIILSTDLNSIWGFSPGAFGIIAACVLWGLDNNFTRNVSAKDPLSIVTWKGLLAGGFSLGLAVVLGNQLPDFWVMIRAMLLGSLCYGASIVLFIHALRGLGAARTSAYFSTAPLAGMILSLAIYRELPVWTFFISVPIMIFGTVLLVTENHEHHHVHRFTIHEHAHTHNDDHHTHEHDIDLETSHSHPHTHEEIAHEHGHMPDIHHRHDHS